MGHAGRGSGILRVNLLGHFGRMRKKDRVVED